MTQNFAQSKIYHIKVDSLDTTTSENGKSAENSDTDTVDSNKATVTKKSSGLSGLLAHYNSNSEADSDSDESTENSKLDGKVDSFLQEINEIKPSKRQDKEVKSNKTIIAWQECFDEGTGYPYYWNVETNQVTWEMPSEYKMWLEKQSVSQPRTKIENLPLPTNEPKIIATTEVEKPVEVPVKIEKAIEIPNKVVNKRTVKNKLEKNIKQKKVVKSKKISSDSEDEKIVMITSFCEESSESETENVEKIEPPKVDILETKEPSPLRVLGPHIEDIPAEIRETTVIPKEENKKEIIECFKEEIDETVILARLRTQAKVLQELDGELPESVDRLLNSLDKTEITPSLSLVAGYGDDSENEDELNSKILFPKPNINNSSTVAESTLFPITKPIDISQFTLPEEEKPVLKEPIVETVDTKVFKRKKRIAFDVLPTKPEKKLKVVENTSAERKGFGFKVESDSNSNENKSYINFKKGGIAFTKSDVLEPPLPVVKIGESKEKEEDFETIQGVVSEKVNFLCEGKSVVSAVQTISIQLQTLEAAYKAGGLTDKYFYCWLRETDTELAILEKDAAPDGWLCYWDRSNKRYFYRHEQSGETQWNYPEQDIIGGGEAMDICTTPPPEEDVTTEDVEPEPPSPPVITNRSPSPPPPPIITVCEETPHNKDEYQPPLPIGVEIVLPPPPPPPLISQDQPLPPGVDPPEQIYIPVKSENKKSDLKRTSFGSELDSFYSDIALLEATKSNLDSECLTQNIDAVTIPNSEINNDLVIAEVPVKKKKKSKSKLGQGVNMKKKAVSTLVEKWKKVQNDYM